MVIIGGGKMKISLAILLGLLVYGGLTFIFIILFQIFIKLIRKYKKNKGVKNG